MQAPGSSIRCRSRAHPDSRAHPRSKRPPRSKRRPDHTADWRLLSNRQNNRRGQGWPVPVGCKLENPGSRSREGRSCRNSESSPKRGFQRGQLPKRGIYACLFDDGFADSFTEGKSYLHYIDHFSVLFDMLCRAECPVEHSPGLLGPGILKFSNSGLKGHKNVADARSSILAPLSGRRVVIRFFPRPNLDYS